MPVPFVDPKTHEVLERDGDTLALKTSGAVVAKIVDGIPRFVDGSEYAASFGWQWNRWHDPLSDERSTGDSHRREILDRTHFERYDLAGKTLLECGMGGGDDTEILLTFPLSEIHAFDLSNAVDRAAAYLTDPRLTLSQASIFEIPYADESFDIVFCHRVVQHTPDPEAALRAVCRKVRPGGLLFAHSYKLSLLSLMQYKYKYRFITKRLDLESVARFVDRFGERFYRVHQWGRRRPKLLRYLLWSFLPFSDINQYGDRTEEEMIELSKLCTFDALTPRYDKPLTARRFRNIIESEGFQIEHFYEATVSPVYCTAVKE